MKILLEIIALLACITAYAMCVNSADAEVRAAKMYQEHMKKLELERYDEEES